MQPSDQASGGCRVVQNVQETLLRTFLPLRAPETHFGPRLFVFEVYKGIRDQIFGSQILIIFSRCSVTKGVIQDMN